MKFGKFLTLTFDTNCQCGGGSAHTIGSAALISARVFSYGLQDVQGAEAKVVHCPERQIISSVNKWVLKENIKLRTPFMSCHHIEME